MFDKSLSKIYWEDAVIYGPENNSGKLGLVKKITEGEIMRKDEDYILVKDPKTTIYDKKSKAYVPSSKGIGATYFYIPIGMIRKILGA
jgi:hypothetical protein